MAYFKFGELIKIHQTAKLKSPQNKPRIWYMKKVLQCGIEPGTSCITGMFIAYQSSICLWQVGGLSNIPQTNYYLTPI